MELLSLYSSISRPRAIGDFFTWGPVITDNSYYRESRLKRAALSDVIVKQPLEAVRLLKRVNVPIIIGATCLPAFVVLGVSSSYGRVKSDSFDSFTTLSSRAVYVLL